MKIRKNVYKMAVPVFTEQLFITSIGVLNTIISITLKWGIIGLWSAMYFDFTTRGIIYYLRLQRGKWKERVVIQ